MSDLQQLTESFWQELDEMYQRLNDGLDVSPAHHYRLEGKAQLLYELQVFSFADLKQACLEKLAQMPRGALNDFWNNAAQEGVIRLPVYMLEAPVYKG